VSRFSLRKPSSTARSFLTLVPMRLAAKRRTTARETWRLTKAERVSIPKNEELFRVPPDPAFRCADGSAAKARSAGIIPTRIVVPETTRRAKA